MADDQDSRPRGERTKRPDTDLALTLAAVAEVPESPVPAAPARRAAEILTVTAEPSPELIEGRAPPDREPPGRPRGWSDLALGAVHSEIALVVLTHGDAVTSAAFSPDSQRIVTASDDKTARVWKADGTGEPLVLRGHEDRVLSAAWSPDGQRIVTTSGDNTARVWTGLTPLRGADDPRLWLVTRYCLSIERRTQLLNVSEATARADQEACERRVEAARVAASGSH
jgi:dipeptidyl aminopeptidase/acylaminoacyl peptidase